MKWNIRVFRVLSVSSRRALSRAAAVAPLVLLTACAGLRPAEPETASTYLLDTVPKGSNTAAKADGPTLIVSSPRAMPGYDGVQMAYTREPHKLEYFARNQWADTPARMLAPLLVRALEHRGAFRAVTGASPVRGELRLDTELIRLHQDFTARPSRVRLTVRAQLVDTARKRVVASRMFDAAETAPADTPYGGVVAANRALARVLDQIAEFAAASAAIAKN